MKIYLTRQDAIYGLHKNGYTHDFQIFGNDLYWIDEKIFVRAGDFLIDECHQFTDHLRKGYGIMIFGIVAPYHNVKGMLIRRYIATGLQFPPVLLKKLNDILTCCTTKISEKIIQPLI